MEIANYSIILFLAIALIFAIIVVRIISGFFRVKACQFESVNKLTVLVPFKNESHQLPVFLNYLKRAIPTNRDVNILFINDHSDDLTPKLIEEIEKEESFHLLTLPENLAGKKSAVTYGVQHSKSEWILQLDIDTSPDSELLNPGNRLIPIGSKMVLIPLHPTKTGGIASVFFALDFLSLHFTGLGMARLGVPVLANAAAMFVNRDAYLKALEIRTDWKEPSGDDIFLMMAIRKIFGSSSIKVIPNLYPLASVLFPKGFKKLWNQRRRWISKTGQVQNFSFQFLSVIVLLVQILLFYGYCFIAISGMKTVVTLPMSIIFISEIFLLAIAVIFAKRSELLIYLIPAVLVYPFYLLALIISSVFKRTSWK